MTERKRDPQPGGRPRILADSRHVSIQLDASTVAELDRRAGLAPRSAVLRALILQALGQDVGQEVTHE